MSAREAKLCECGCGEPAPIAQIWQHGYATGQAKRFIQGHNARTVDLYDVDPETGCWIWHRPGPRGYGRIMRDGVNYPAHRYVYERETDPCPRACSLTISAAIGAASIPSTSRP